jgi:hypothetical protein
MHLTTGSAAALLLAASAAGEALPLHRQMRMTIPGIPTIQVSERDAASRCAARVSAAGPLFSIRDEVSTDGLCVMRRKPMEPLLDAHALYLSAAPLEKGRACMYIFTRTSEG